MCYLSAIGASPAVTRVSIEHHVNVNGSTKFLLQSRCSFYQQKYQLQAEKLLLKGAFILEKCMLHFRFENLS